MIFWKQYWYGLKRDLLKMIGISLIIGLFIALLFSSSGTPMNLMAIYTIHGAIISLFLWLGNAFIVEFLNYKYSWLKHPKTRVTLGIISSLIFTIVGFVLIQVLLYRLFYNQPISNSLNSFQFSNLYMPIVITAMITLSVHLVAFFNEWRKSEVEKEALKREHLASQFETLKSQVNPHFLFN
ncbi:MAG: hypothetical protein AB8G11_24985, partial [Saprospiraceae bacterium]